MKKMLVQRHKILLLLLHHEKQQGYYVYSFIEQLRLLNNKKKQHSNKNLELNPSDLFDFDFSKKIINSMDVNKAKFLYIPWIAEHSDSLIQKIVHSEYDLIPFNFSKNISKDRRSISRFAREKPVFYRDMILSMLTQLKGLIVGVIFTFDWLPAMRLISNVCEDLAIPRILIPHESVFVNRDKYYWDQKSYASVPAADIVLGWGRLQESIFSERGFPQSRFLVTGAPKFDVYFNYQSLLNRYQFCQFFGFMPSRKIILFACQPLDSQLDSKLARHAQRQAIYDLICIVEQSSLQMIVRLPPSKDDVLGKSLRLKINDCCNVSIDDATRYFTSAEDSVFHCDLVVSINSTMLLEAVLLGRPALSLKYLDINTVWACIGIPSVESRKELKRDILNIMKNWRVDSAGLQFAADMFSNGVFDGKSSERIKKYLSNVANEIVSIDLRKNSAQRLFIDNRDDGIDVISIHSSIATCNSKQRYLAKTLNAQNIVCGANGLEDPVSICSVDLFLQWGITPRPEKIIQAVAQRALGRPYIIVEDGFIRSINIGLSGEPALSFILDDTTAYYDAVGKPSRLERLLNSSFELNASELSRARFLIQKMKSSGISKYNHAPSVDLTKCFPNLNLRKHRVLVIDQRYQDQSVISGLATQETFDQMVLDAINLYPNSHVLIKSHPDAISGDKESYLNFERLEILDATQHVTPIFFDINPYSLFNQVDEVFVATSGMGFEALMAGHMVHCYGMPFYAGWGLTQDRQFLARRQRSRRLEDVFHLAYIESSRYFHPILKQRVSLELLIDYILQQVDW